ncbi:MAG TPA: hypothetical protein VGM94_01650 [Galbitalea sp.]|jgi:hypothetical protein
MDAREEAWGRLHEAMPARWTVGQPSYDPGRPGWSISAVGPNRGRGKVPTYVSGVGESALAALQDLDARLRGERAEGPRRMDELRARQRLAYVEGAEDWARSEMERPLTRLELEGVLRRFPTDIRAEPR